MEGEMLEVITLCPVKN